jgi:hypothetical protein
MLTPREELWSFELSSWKDIGNLYWKRKVLDREKMLDVADLLKK